jgi:hypothetical protein
LFNKGQKTNSYVPKPLVPVHFAGYFGVSSIISVAYMTYLGFILWLGSKLSFFKNLLLKYPHYASLGVFRLQGPTAQQLRESSFETQFIGQGFMNDDADQSMEIRTRVVGPEPGYVTTPICAVTCAATLLNASERKSIPNGVLTPAAAFNGVAESIFTKLGKRGLTFTEMSVSK